MAEWPLFNAESVYVGVSRVTSGDVAIREKNADLS